MIIVNSDYTGDNNDGIIQQRIGTTAEWNEAISKSIYPAKGEIIVEIATEQDPQDSSKTIQVYKSRLGIGKEITKIEDLPLMATEGGSGVGQKTSDGGEIFNTYQDIEGTYYYKNKALGGGSHAEGVSTTAGMKRIKVIDIDTVNKTITIPSKDIEKLQNVVKNKLYKNQIEQVYLFDFSTNVFYNTPIELDLLTLKKITINNNDSYVLTISNFTEGLINEEVINDVKEPFNNIYLAITSLNGLFIIAETLTEYGSHAEGKLSQAIGEGSHAEGRDTKAFGNSSHAEGEKSIAAGDNSHTEGKETAARGLQSHAEGSSTQAHGNSSHAEGQKTRANGTNSHAENTLTIADGNNSHAEGDSTVAYGNSSHSEGWETRSQGEASHAENYQTEAIGKGSHAEGFQTQAYGEYSHAEGYKTRVGRDIEQDSDGNLIYDGKYSHASGEGTIARGTAQTVIGKYNMEEPIDTGKIFVIGNGSSDSERSNAFTVDLNGNTEISGDLVVNGDFTLKGDGNLITSNNFKGEKLLSEILELENNQIGDRYVISKNNVEEYENANANIDITNNENQIWFQPAGLQAGGSEPSVDIFKSSLPIFIYYLNDQEKESECKKLLKENNNIKIMLQNLDTKEQCVFKASPNVNIGSNISYIKEKIDPNTLKTIGLEVYCDPHQTETFSLGYTYTNLLDFFYYYKSVNDINYIDSYSYDTETQSSKFIAHLDSLSNDTLETIKQLDSNIPYFNILIASNPIAWMNPIPENSGWEIIKIPFNTLKPINNTEYNYEFVINNFDIRTYNEKPFIEIMDDSSILDNTQRRWEYIPKNLINMNIKLFSQNIGELKYKGLKKGDQALWFNEKWNFISSPNKAIHTDISKNSISMGVNNINKGTISFTFGENNNILPINNGLALGKGLKITRDNQVVIGQYNEPNEKDDCIIFGMGDSLNNTKNILILDKEGINGCENVFNNISKIQAENIEINNTVNTTNLKTSTIKFNNDQDKNNFIASYIPLFPDFSTMMAQYDLDGDNSATLSQNCWVIAKTDADGKIRIKPKGGNAIVVLAKADAGTQSKCELSFPAQKGTILYGSGKDSSSTTFTCYPMIPSILESNNNQ